MPQVNKSHKDKSAETSSVGPMVVLSVLMAVVSGLALIRIFGSQGPEGHSR